MTHLSKSQIMRRRLGRLMLVAAVPALAIGTSKGAWTDNVRVEARVTFAQFEQTERVQTERVMTERVQTEREMEPQLQPQPEPSIEEPALDPELGTMLDQAISQEIGKVVGGPAGGHASPE